MLDSSSVIDLDEDHEYARYDISSRVLFSKSLLAQQVRDHSMCRITATPAHTLAPELVHPFFCPPAGKDIALGGPGQEEELEPQTQRTRASSMTRS